MGVVRGLQAIGVWALIERWIPSARLFPALAPQVLPPSSRRCSVERGRVGFLTGCVAAVVQPEVNAAALRVLDHCDISVAIPPAQRCCGALHLHAGDLEGARRLARANIDAFAAGPLAVVPLDAVVVTAAGCGAAMGEYGDLLGEDPAYADAAARFASMVRDITEYVDDLGDSVSGGTAASAATPMKVTYHDACHLAHAQGIRDQPRDLLRRIPGLELVELDEADRCCGSAGSYNLTEPEIARALASRKADRIERSGADCVAVANPGCALQIGAELRHRGNRMRVAHPIELVAESLPLGDMASAGADTNPIRRAVRDSVAE